MPVKRLGGIKAPKAAAKKPRVAPTAGINAGKPKTSVAPPANIPGAVKASSKPTNATANTFRGTKRLKGAPI